MKTNILCIVTLVVTSFASQAAITIYNQNNPPDTTDLPSGGWGTYRGFSVNFSDIALSTDYTAPDSAPTPPTILLQTLTLRHSGTQGAGSTPISGEWETAILKVYTSQTPSTATYVGDSLNSNDMSQTGSERNVTYSFSNLEMDSNTQYFFYFSNTAGNEESSNITWAAGRLRVSNNTALTYGSGGLISQAFTNADTAYDPVFAATFIPEPSVVLLGGLGLLGLLRRRRA